MGALDRTRQEVLCEGRLAWPFCLGLSAGLLAPLLLTLRYNTISLLQSFFPFFWGGGVVVRDWGLVAAFKIPH